MPGTAPGGLAVAPPEALDGCGFDRTNAFAAAGIVLVAFAMYARTVAPTLSFWDCGEFIASSYKLEVGH
ncbi:MAG TPA: hypothetical protein PKY95_10945, partial [candidate division Zixibacteria bacterium]|nr:hypothetical protein [candidate division Zixibacteria bacterium]